MEVMDKMASPLFKYSKEDIQCVRKNIQDDIKQCQSRFENIGKCAFETFRFICDRIDSNLIAYISSAGEIRKGASEKDKKFVIAHQKFACNVCDFQDESFDVLKDHVFEMHVNLWRPTIGEQSSNLWKAVECFNDAISNLARDRALEHSYQVASFLGAIQKWYDLLDRETKHDQGKIRKVMIGNGKVSLVSYKGGFAAGEILSFEPSKIAYECKREGLHDNGKVINFESEDDALAEAHRQTVLDYWVSPFGTFELDEIVDEYYNDGDLTDTSMLEMVTIYDNLTQQFYLGRFADLPAQLYEMTPVTFTKNGVIYGEPTIMPIETLGYHSANEDKRALFTMEVKPEKLNKEALWFYPENL